MRHVRPAPGPIEFGLMEEARQFSVRASLEQFTLPHPGGEGQFKISVAAPAMVLHDARVPVLYVADGALLFGLAAAIARAMMTVGVLPPFYVATGRESRRKRVS